MVILDTKEELFSNLMEGMNSLRKDKSLYDVCITVGDHQITAHKSVLAVLVIISSPCFCDL